LSEAKTQAALDVSVVNREGVHARPVMRFVDLASRYQSKVSVTNVSRRGEKLDGKSAMQMMLLEATQGCVLRIEACGVDAEAAVDQLGRLVQAGFGDAPHDQAPDEPPRRE
jgi:phosphotransferase system HPr (HPr) family protein